MEKLSCCEIMGTLKLNNVYIEVIQTNRKNISHKAEKIAIQFYKSKGYNVAKLSHSLEEVIWKTIKTKSGIFTTPTNIRKNHPNLEEITKVLPWFKDFYNKPEKGWENGKPDLIVYKSNKDWFFAEVKASNDTVRLKQLEWYLEHPKFRVHICIVKGKHQPTLYEQYITGYISSNKYKKLKNALLMTQRRKKERRHVKR